jgi:nanoRNase/pAp phosphatase (c-di-AMP/oligoRNAs hydrolase)
MIFRIHVGGGRVAGQAEFLTGCTVDIVVGHTVAGGCRLPVTVFKKLTGMISLLKARFLIDIITSVGECPAGIGLNSCNR